MSQHPLPDNLHIDTLAVRAAVDRSQYGENSEALYLTSGYVQPDAETAARRFAGEEEGYTYARLGNPTVASMEARLAALEGSEACIATSTGMSAILLMCLGLLKSGDHVICSHSMLCKPPLFLKPKWRSGKRPCGPTPDCCLLKHRPIP